MQIIALMSCPEESVLIMFLFKSTSKLFRVIVYSYMFYLDLFSLLLN